MKNNHNRTEFIMYSALIAAIYVVLCVMFQPISYGAIQVRVAEALTILPYFTPAGIPGVTIGCLLSNILSGANILDIVFGTIATLIGACGSYALRKYKYLVPLPPIIANTIIVPWVLKFAYGEALPIPFMMLTVGVGEVLAAGVIGMIFLLVLERYKDQLFRPSISSKQKQGR